MLASSGRRGKLPLKDRTPDAERFGRQALPISKAWELGVRQSAEELIDLRTLLSLVELHQLLGDTHLLGTANADQLAVQVQ